MSSPVIAEPPLSEPRARWRSDEPSRPRTSELDGRQRSQSFDDVPRSPTGSVSGVVVGVGGTYLDLSTVVPAARSDQTGDKASSTAPASFCKTQSSPDLDKTPEPPVTFPATSQSTDELYVYARRSESRQVQGIEDLEQNVTSLSSYSAATSMDTPHPEEEQPAPDRPAAYATFHLEGSKDELEEATRDYDQSTMNNGRTTNAAESTDVRLQKASAAGPSGRQPLRKKEVALDGVEKALRAPERSATGGLSFYVNLEDHHFDRFPAQLGEGRDDSADNHSTA